jgi:formylglycine-generating enzyme required for sulfatase activity
MSEQSAKSILNRAFIEERSASEFWPSNSWWHPSEWDSIVRDILVEQRQPAKLLAWLATAQPALALRSAQDQIGEVDPATRQVIIATARVRASDQHAVGRATAYRVLGELDADTRLGIHVSTSEGVAVPEFVWVDIPAGHFLARDHKELRESNTIRIAAYPLTNAQYEAFIQSNGYLVQRYWTESGWKWLQAHEITGPDQFGKPFGITNHPRVGVSWYEAVAYTRWLNEVYNERHIQCNVRLPSEFELERAIRGDEGNRFAYGDEIDYSRCNGGGTGIGSTCAVGIFPEACSPHGLYDATGNVWEWTLSTPDEEWGNNLDSDESRVIRGGSWNYFGNYLRAAFRYWYAPLSRNSIIGIRLAAYSD